MLRVEQLSAESAHGLQCDVPADDHMRLLARVGVTAGSILALLAVQLEKLSSLLRDDNQRADHDNAVKHLTVR